MTTAFKGLDRSRVDEIQTLVQTYPAGTQTFMTMLLWEREMVLLRTSKTVAESWAFSSYYDLLLKHGEGPRVEKVATDDVLGTMEERACYSNCYEAALEYTGYTYVEGLALADWALVRHAWLEDEHGRIIDPTWVNLQGSFGSVATYYGIRFTTDFLLRHTMNTKHHSFFDADWMHDYQILRRGLKINDFGMAYDLGGAR